MAQTLFQQPLKEEGAMRRRFGVWCPSIRFGGAAAIAVVLSVRAAGVEAAFRPAPPGQVRPAPASTAIPCRVLESHTSDRDQMTVVVFHQRDAGDRTRLGELI